MAPTKLLNKPQFKNQVEARYPKFKERADAGKAPGFYAFFHPRVHKACAKQYADENRTREEILNSMQEMAFKLELNGSKENPSFTIAWVSPGYEKVLGYSAKAAIGTDIMRNVHPEDLPGLARFVNERMISKDGGAATFRSLKADGTYIWIEGTGNPIFNANGEVAGAVIVSRDISERVKMQKELEKAVISAKEAAEKVRSLGPAQSLIMDNARDLINIVSIPDGKLIRFSRSYLTEMGYSEEDLLGMNTLSTVHPDDVGLATRMFEQGLETGEGMAEVRVMKKDGTYIWMEVKGNIVRDDDGNPICGILVSRNIDELKKVRDRLRESEEKFREVFEHSPIAIEVYGKDGIISDINPSCARLFGIGGFDAVKGFNLFADPNLSEEMLARVKNGESVSYEVAFDFSKVPYKTAESGIKHMSVCVSRVDASNGLGYVAQIVDVTKQKETERLLRHTITEKDRFMDIIAHDLKTPFNALLGFSGLLLEEYDNFDDKDKLDMVGNINKVSKDAYKLLETLLEYSRVQAGKYNVPSTKFSLCNIAESERSKLVPEAGKKGIDIYNLIKSDLQVNANELLVEHIFQNLLTNAIKFSHKGGKITISAAPPKGGMVEVKVTDQGVGIDAARTPFLFEVCKENVSTLGTANEKGTGFGLPLVADMVKKNGGEIWVDTKTGENSGSIFHFTLPFAPD